MRRAFLVLLVALTAAAAVVAARAEDAPTPTSPPDLAQLSWLTGSWVEAEGPSVFRETWGAPLGDALVGSCHWAVGGKTRMYELLVIEQTPQGIVLRIRHFGRGVEPWASEKDGPLSWPLKSLKGSQVLFEHPTRAWPKVMEYRRQGKILEGRLAGIEDGKPKEIPFRFVLQD